MSNKGYSLERETENFFLKIANQKRSDSLFSRTFRVPTSGAMMGMKGDVRTSIPWLEKQFMIECKGRNQQTVKEGRIIYIEPQWINKLEQEAEQDNMIPLLVFSFKGVRKFRLWGLIPRDKFNYIETICNSKIIRDEGLTNYKVTKKGTYKIAYSQLAKWHLYNNDSPYIVKTINLNNKLYYVFTLSVLEYILTALNFMSGKT